MTPDWITYHFHFDKTDVNAPAGISVEDNFMDNANPQPWRVVKVEVTRFASGNVDVSAEGIRLTASGKPDQRNTYSHLVHITEETEAAFVEATK